MAINHNDTFSYGGFFSHGSGIPAMVNIFSCYSGNSDFIASREKKPGVVKVAVASAVMHTGQAWGAIIPAMFFADKYKEEWIKRGQTAEAMDAMIKYTAGQWGVIASVIVFIMAFIGAYIGYFILRKHFKEV